MLDFYRTSGGRRLCDSTLPEIRRQLKRLADELRRANNLKEVELGLRKIGPGDVAREFVEGEQTGTFAGGTRIQPGKFDGLPDEIVVQFVGSLLQELGTSESLDCTTPEDLGKLRDSGVRRRLRDAGVSIEFNDDETEATLTKEG